MERLSSVAEFLRELKRRHVWRAVIVYAAAAFVLLQLGEIVLPAFGMPDAALRPVIVIVLLGFPVVLALAWVYEITPQGIRRTSEMDAEAGEPGRGPRLLPRLTFLALTLLTVATAGWWLVRWSVDSGVSARGDVAAERVTRSDGSAGGPGELASRSELAASIRSLAVLPFESHSASEESDFFTAGMHEALVSELSRISAIRVVSRTSVMQYAGTTRTAPEIARELRVEGIIEGSVLRADGQVRITVQLIHGPTDTHLWTNQYDRDFSDILTLQKEVAEAIAGEIRAELTPEEQVRLASSDDVDPEAHEAYLRGRFEEERGTVEALDRALDYYEKALDEDSTFAPALAGLASARLQLLLREPDLAATEILEAHEAAESALALDPGSPEARVVSAEIRRHIAESLPALGSELARRALHPDSIDPSNFARIAELGRALAMEGLRIAAAPEERATTMAGFRISAARQLAAAGLHERATELLEETLEESPAPGEGWALLEYLHASHGDYEEAVAVRGRRATRPDAAEAEATVARELAAAVQRRGADGYWERRLEELRAAERAGEDVSQVRVAAAHVSLGQLDAALERLERAEAANDPDLGLLRSDPLWDPLRSDPRFRELLRRLRARPPAPPPPTVR